MVEYNVRANDKCLCWCLYHSHFDSVIILCNLFVRLSFTFRLVLILHLYKSKNGSIHSYEPRTWCSTKMDTQMITLCVHSPWEQRRWRVISWVKFKRLSTTFHRHYHRYHIIGLPIVNKMNNEPKFSRTLNTNKTISTTELRCFDSIFDYYLTWQHRAWR